MNIKLEIECPTEENATTDMNRTCIPFFQAEKPIFTLKLSVLTIGHGKSLQSY